MKTILAIDPGLKGGIVVMSEQGEIIHTEKMPVIRRAGKGAIDFGSVAKTVKTYQPSLMVLEEVHAMPNQGSVSGFSFGTGFGGLQAIAATLEVPLVHVRPQAWQKLVFAGIDKAIGKGRSLLYCKRMFPNIEPTHKHDGIADAACMAKWAISSQQI